MKIAIIGFGSIGMRHLSNLLALGVKDVVIVSTHIANNNVNVDGTEIPVVNDITDIISSIDAMVVSNATNLHQEYLKLAVDNNIHAYVEKPVACNTDQLEEIAKQVVEKGIVVVIGTQFRFNQKLVQLKKLLDGDCLGQILSVISSHGEHIADYHPGEDYKLSYAASKEKCGGVLLTQIHHIDYLDWLFGPFTYAYANEMPAPSLGIDVDAIINYSLICEESKLQVHGHMNYLQRPKSTSLHVIGESGAAYWDYEKNTLKLSGLKDVNIAEDGGPLDRNKMFLLTMGDFLDSIASSRDPKANLSAGIRTLNIAESIMRSTASKAVDKIAYSEINSVD